jgi:hypothetical protein
VHDDVVDERTVAHDRVQDPVTSSDNG